MSSGQSSPLHPQLIARSLERHTAHAVSQENVDFVKVGVRAIDSGDVEAGLDAVDPAVEHYALASTSELPR